MVFTDLKQMVAFATKGKLPDWQTQLFCKYRDQIQVHSKGLIFYKIDRLFPNEDPKSKEVRILSFEPITRGSFLKGVSNINRIFSNSSYSAEFSASTKAKAKETVFNGKNLFAFYLENWLKVTLAEDPNALLVVYPEDYANSKSIPVLSFISSEHVVYFDSETYIFKSEIESTIEYTLKNSTSYNQYFYDESVARPNITEAQQKSYNQTLETKFIKTVYHVFDKDKFYILTPVEGSANEYDVETIQLKNFKSPPVQFVEAVKNNKVNESFLSSFIPFGNLALLQHSQHMAVNFSFSFPRIREIEYPCEYPTCNDGYIECPVSDLFPDGTKPCPQCKGSGVRNVTSPFKTYNVKYDPSGLTDNKEMLEADPVKFYTPDTSILTYSKEEWKGYLEAAEMAIYVQQKVQTGNVQSEGSKQIDLDELHAFLISVAKAFYNGLRFVLQCYENYNNANPVTVGVNVPFSFAILTESEAFDALNKILLSNVPDIIKGNQIENFINKFVSENSPVKKAYQVLKIVDVLILKNTTEISTLKGNVIVTAEQWAVHAFAYAVLMQMYTIDATLFELEINEIVKKLQTELVAYMPKAEDLKQNMINKFGGGN